MNTYLCFTQSPFSHSRSARKYYDIQSYRYIQRYYSFHPQNKYARRKLAKSVENQMEFLCLYNFEPNLIYSPNGLFMAMKYRNYNSIRYIFNAHQYPKEPFYDAASKIGDISLMHTFYEYQYSPDTYVNNLIVIKSELYMNHSEIDLNYIEIERCILSDIRSIQKSGFRRYEKEFVRYVGTLSKDYSIIKYIKINYTKEPRMMNIYISNRYLEKYNT